MKPEERQRDHVFHKWAGWMGVEEGTFLEAGFRVSCLEKEDWPLDILKLEHLTLVRFNCGEYEAFRQHCRDGGWDESEAAVRSFLKDRSIRLNPPDLVFYLEGLPCRAARREQDVTVRRLSEEDRAAFERMMGGCPPSDVEAAFVRLEHPLVFGAYVLGQLASCASAYGSPISDIGILTHPGFRARGLAGATVFHLCLAIQAQGGIPQYRVQPQLTASVAVARSLGFRPFCRWEYMERD